MRVQLLTPKQAAAAVQATKPEPPKEVRTQASAAPKEVPKPPPSKKKKTALKGPVMVSASEVALANHPPIESENLAEVSPTTETPKKRPDKLDKTPGDRKVVKSDDKKAEVVSNSDDFLKALDFVKGLQSATSSTEDGGQDTDTLIVVENAEVAAIKAHIEQNWYRPPGLKDSDKLAARVKVRISRDGTIESLELLESSGQEFYDNSLLRAVRKSVPFPLPPEKYEKFKVLDLHFKG